MTTIKLILTIVQLLSCVAITAIVILQSGKSSGLSGAISGNTDSFLSKNKGKSMDAVLAKATKWIAAVFILLTLVLNFGFAK